MGQMKQFAYRLAEYLYEKGCTEEEIIEELLVDVDPDVNEKAEAWIRKQIQYLKEHPYPTRNMLEY